MSTNLLVSAPGNKVLLLVFDLDGSAISSRCRTFVILEFTGENKLVILFVANPVDPPIEFDLLWLVGQKGSSESLEGSVQTKGKNLSILLQELLLNFRLRVKKTFQNGKKKWNCRIVSYNVMFSS